MDRPSVDTSIKEYNEGLPVVIEWRNDRWCVVAMNEGGYNSTAVDLGDILDWVKTAPDFVDLP